MARWKLTEPHYLNVPGTKWELTTTDRSTGRPARKVFAVPRYLHPEDPTEWNYRDNFGDGEIIVCHEGKGLPNDIIFLGDPTPGMLPLDEEAEAITKTFSAKWTPTAGTDEQSQNDSFQAKLLNGLIDSMSTAQATAAQLPVAPGIEKLLEAMTAMMQQNQQMMQLLAGKVTGAVDQEPPLEDVEPTQQELFEASQAAAVAQAASADRATAHALRGRR